MQTVSLRVGNLEIPAPLHLGSLAGIRGICVSAYLSGYPPGAGARPIPIRLHSMLSEIDGFLKKREVSEQDRVALLGPLTELRHCLDPEKGHREGLVIFRTLSSMRLFRVPWDVPDQWAVESCANIRPLLAGMHPRSRFWLLALARNHVRLFDVMSDFREVALPDGVPRSFEEFTALDPPGEQASNHSGAADGAVVFGTGSIRDKMARHLHDFHAAIAHGMRRFVRKDARPLVVAGTARDAASFLALCTYEDTVPRPLVMSPDDGARAEQMIREARHVVEDFLTARERHAIAQYKELERANRVSTVTETILKQAAAGHVLHLFINTTERQPGDAHWIAGRVPMSGDFTSVTEDLVNAAAVETLRHGGDVWMVPAGDSGLAAALRY